MAYTDLNLSKVLIPRRLKIRSELTSDIDIEDDAEFEKVVEEFDKITAEE